MIVMWFEIKCLRLNDQSSVRLNEICPTLVSLKLGPEAELLDTDEINCSKSLREEDQTSQDW